MKKLVVLLLLICSTAQARDFYFSSDGSNNNDCSSEYPCDSNIITNKQFHPGDVYYFERGDTWKHSDNLWYDGTEDNPTVITNNIFYANTDDYITFENTTSGNVESVTISVSKEEFLDTTADWEVNSGGLIYTDTSGANGQYLKSDGNGATYWSDDAPAQSEAINETKEWKDYWARLYEKS